MAQDRVELSEGYLDIYTYNLDLAAKTAPQEREEKSQGLVLMLLVELGNAGVPVSTLEHLKVKIRDLDKRQGTNRIKVEVETQLGEVQTKVLEMFGAEVYRRLDLSLSSDKVFVRR